jgi:cytochrome c oxidase subunit 3
MAITVTGTKPRVDKKVSRGGSGFPGSNGGNGNGWKKNGGGGPRFSPQKYRITMWVLLAAIIMMFVALSSAYIVLSSSEQWRPVRMPRVFFLSTGIILLSSITLRTASKSLTEGAVDRYRRWLSLTLLLGLVFLVSQLFGWRELVAQGVYFSGQPHSSFFFLFTGLHGVHLAGGIVALLYLVAYGLRKRPEEFDKKGRALVDAMSLYWHVMDALWIWLFLLLLVWR